MASAALAMAAPIVSGLLGNKGANEAAKIFNQSGLDANATDYRLYNTQRTDQAPYTNLGAGSANYLSYLLGVGGGPGGQVAGPGSNTRLNTPTASAMAGMDGKNGSIKANGNGFTWVPGSGNARGFTFLYNDGVNDVYQRSSGGKGTGINLDYAVVGKDGKVNFTGQPPIAGSNAAAGSAPPPGSANDPNFGSLMKDFSASDFQADPGYAFRLQEGAKALERSAASKGSLFSGGTLKDLTKYNSGVASDEFQNAYNRYQTNRATKFNQLAATTGIGQVSANTLSNATNQLEGNLNQNTMQSATNEANARASGYSALGRGLGGAINNFANWYQMQQDQKKNNQNVGSAVYAGA